MILPKASLVHEGVYCGLSVSPRWLRQLEPWSRAPQGWQPVLASWEQLHVNLEVVLHRSICRVYPSPSVLFLADVFYWFSFTSSVLWQRVSAFSLHWACSELPLKSVYGGGCGIREVVPASPSLCCWSAVTCSLSPYPSPGLHMMKPWWQP